MDDDRVADLTVAAGVLAVLGAVGAVVVRTVQKDRADVREIEYLRTLPAKPRWTDANRWDRD